MKEGKKLGIFNISTFIFTIINLLVLYFILKWLLFKPVTQFLENRENKIKSSLEEANRERQEAHNLKAKYEEILKNADNEGKAIIEKAQKAAEDKANKIIENANKEAENIIEKAKEEAMLEKIKAMHDLRTEISQLVIDAASRVLEKKLPVADEDLINEVIEEAGASWHK
ncbi:F0F1 ATP synthase subunit B [Thermoanaerobacter thermohydrosulfuricus]|uniref:ATP synthase subunit b n=2 Tax=Thermoanaerobacter TaxID=1754 RepID=I8QZP7_9THEO|nr:F0F1 ATP synthase subunit B [Thermoanaerobacter thermohydrosulfuricus]EGD51403.1 ATP synthase F0, B subunit [Thermoanaerobacter ethanolicus JW 200]EIW00643.1 ATP synthase, F0 subunit b [Thermoanaerobacter siderophilus SR4]EMT39934.1 ATP synthase, F0 subunit b [Thermoanaerobacter thermohydrosulfuricus WC1]SFE58016.1 ATP synthase F0 subcomplex B subunit [Thermoanaerobacter thermohydrosulfuricus]